MPYQEVYAKLTEEQKEKERKRAREWHQKNYARIRERKLKYGKQYYADKGQETHKERSSVPKYKLQRLLTNAKIRSKKQRVNCTITLDYLVELYVLQNGVCALTGRPFDLEPDGTQVAKENAMSIDKIIPEQGYVSGNVRLVVHHINMAMSHFGYDAFLKLAQDARAHND